MTFVYHYFWFLGDSDLFVKNYRQRISFPTLKLWIMLFLFLRKLFMYKYSGLFHFDSSYGFRDTLAVVFRGCYTWCMYPLPYNRRVVKIGPPTATLRNRGRFSKYHKTFHCRISVAVLLVGKFIIILYQTYYKKLSGFAYFVENPPTEVSTLYIVCSQSAVQLQIVGGASNFPSIVVMLCPGTELNNLPKTIKRWLHQESEPVRYKLLYLWRHGRSSKLQILLFGYVPKIKTKK